MRLGPLLCAAHDADRDVWGQSMRPIRWLALCLAVFATIWAILLGVELARRPGLWDDDFFLGAFGLGVLSAGLTEFTVLAILAGVRIRGGDRTSGMIVVLAMSTALFVFLAVSFLTER
jgi:hypothetical protein